MKFVKTDLKDVYVLELEKLVDERGFFARSFCTNELEAHGIAFQVAQMNISYNPSKHTFRGMHYQVEPKEEAKLIRCTRGSIYDAIIDVRRDSPTYMQWLSVELSDRNYRILYVPEGFAHGFITLEDGTEVNYQVSEFYNPGAERGIRWDDPAFAISWPAEPRLISDKDQNWPDFTSS